jgi:outer membrane autotransporter protein
MNGIGKNRKAILLGGSAVALALFASSAAQAQCVSTLPGVLPGNGLPSAPVIPFATGGSLNSLVSVLNTVNTAFLTQTNAFIGAPANAPPNQMGGGVWTRGIGGRIDTDSVGTTTVADALGPAPGNVTCNTTTRTEFAGYQAGVDISRLNVGGWNMHWGATVGYTEANAQDITPGSGTFSGTFQVPFVGIYGAVTKGGFFLDGQTRWDFYQNTIADAPGGLVNQQFDARGIAIAANMGYHHVFNNSGWFVEPSVGVVYSRVHVDPIEFGGTLLTTGLGFPGSVQINAIESLLGRASIRVGTNVVSGNFALQPFVTASVFHEFADPVTADFRTCLLVGILGPTCQSAFDPFLGLDVSAQLSTSRVGTYGQFAAGVAGQLLNTGWLGYIRGDYRIGEDIEGWSLNGGIRYQFTPELIAAPIGKGVIGKAPAPPVPVVAPVAWTGFYIGGHAATVFGRWTDERFFDDPAEFVSPILAGVGGGGQIGFNWQTGNWVLGVEGDATWTNATGARACPGLGFGFGNFFNCEYNVNWVATAGVRVGYAYERALFYAKGGAAWSDNDYDIVFNTTGERILTASDTRTGWMGGAGVEYALTQNWSAKAEYTFMDFGTEEVLRTSASGLLAGATIDSESTNHVHAVKVGVNYRFSGLPLGR